MGNTTPRSATDCQDQECETKNETKTVVSRLHCWYTPCLTLWEHLVNTRHWIVLWVSWLSRDDITEPCSMYCCNRWLFRPWLKKVSKLNIWRWCQYHKKTAAFWIVFIPDALWKDIYTHVQWRAVITHSRWHSTLCGRLSEPWLLHWIISSKYRKMYK